MLEYSKNYSRTSGCLWNYYRDELTDMRNNNNDPNKNVFQYKTSITGNTYNVTAGTQDYNVNNKNKKEVEILCAIKRTLKEH